MLYNKVKPIIKEYSNVKKVLVTYGTWTGSTKHAARNVADGLEKAGVKTEMISVDHVISLEGFDGVVIGSAIRAGQIHGGVVKFVDRFASVLAKKPTAFFIICMTMKDDTRENRETVRHYLDPIMEKHPKLNLIDLGMFAGAVEYDKLGLVPRTILKAMRTEEGNYMKEDAMSEWATFLGSSKF